MSLTTTVNIRTLGRLCADMQVPYHRLARIVDAAGIAPALVINGVRHFDETAVERIHAALSRPTHPKAICSK